MKRLSKVKSCKYCGRFFRPDPKVYERQKSCGRESCKKKRRRESQDTWLTKNPGYFKGRYEYTKEWRKKHEGYQRKWRRNKKSGEIQDEIPVQKPLQILRIIVPVKYLRTEIKDEIILTKQSGSVYFATGYRRKIKDKIELGKLTQ